MSILKEDKLSSLFQENRPVASLMTAASIWPYGDYMSKMTRAKAIADNEADSQRQTRRIVGLLAWFAMAILFVLLGCMTSFAQTAPAAPAAGPKAFDSLPIAEAYDYGSIDKNLDRRALRTAERVVREKIRSDEKAIKSALESGRADSVSNFNTFMTGYLLASMTKTDDETLSQLGELRNDFVGDYLSERVSSAGRKNVIDVSFPLLRQIVENSGGKNYHSAARLNAMYLIGQLNSSAGSRASGRLPSLSRNAADYLVSTFTNENAPEFLRIGALAGVEEQARLDRFRGQPELASRTQISQAAFKIVQAPATTPGTYWLKRRAIRTLGWLGNAGSGAVVVELKKIMADNSAKRMLRYDAMEALGNLNYAAVAPATAKDIPELVAGFVSDSLATESKTLQDKWNDLIAKNILFGDRDLEAEGNADKGGRGRDGGGSIGAGGGGALDGGGGAPAPRDDPKKVDLGTRVEIANYHLNDSRRSIKVIANTAKSVISADSLGTHVEAPLVRNFGRALDSLIRESDIGIKNNDEEEPDLDPEDLEAIAEAKKPNTIKLSEKFAEYAAIIGKFDSTKTEDPLAEPAPAGDPAAANN